MAIRGGCLCGLVSYEVVGSLKAAGHCHCPMCRKSHGAAFVTWGFVDPDEFRWTSGAESVERYESSPGKERCFCRKCGSALVIADAGKITEVALGTVDGDLDVSPREHVFVGSKASWYEIADALPQFRRLPPGMES